MALEELMFVRCTLFQLCLSSGHILVIWPTRLLCAVQHRCGYRIYFSESVFPRRYGLPLFEHSARDIDMSKEY